MIVILQLDGIDVELAVLGYVYDEVLEPGMQSVHQHDELVVPIREIALEIVIEGREPLVVHLERLHQLVTGVDAELFLDLSFDERKELGEIRIRAPQRFKWV